MVIVSATTVHRLAKFGWVPFADPRLRSLAMKWDAEFTEGGWKLTSNLKPFADRSSCRFGTMYRRPLIVCNALSRLCIYRVSLRRHRPLKLPLTCEIGPKRWLLDPRFVGVGNTLDIGHAFSNCTYFRPCGQIWLSSVQRPQRLGGEKKKKELENVALIAMYCHLRPPDAIAFPT